MFVCAPALRRGDSPRPDPTIANAYTKLGVTLSGAQTATLADGRTMTKRQLLVEAISLDTAYILAYVNLGATLNGTETATLVDGRTMTKRDVHLLCIEVQPTHRTKLIRTK